MLAEDVKNIVDTLTMPLQHFFELPCSDLLIWLGPVQSRDHGQPEKIEARMTARAFGAVHNAEQGPAVRQVLAELLGVLDATSPDGVI